MLQLLAGAAGRVGALGTFWEREYHSALHQDKGPWLPVIWVCCCVQHIIQGQLLQSHRVVFCVQS